MGDEGPADGADKVTARLTELVGATLHLGASMARSLARATTSKNLPPTGQAPLDDIVQFGAMAARNVIGLVVDGVSSGGRRTSATAPSGFGDGASGSGAGGGARPQVTAGSTLRVPLLVENTGQSATREITFGAASIRREDCPDGASCTCLPTSRASFTPPSIVIAPRDFEKLTVRLATTPETAPGRYRATISGGDGWFSTMIDFSVVAGT